MCGCSCGHLRAWADMLDENAFFSLLLRARNLQAALVARANRSAPEAARVSGVAKRLETSVIRPLRDVFAESSMDVDPTSTRAGSDSAWESDLGEDLWQLARQATVLRTQAGVPAEVQEITAALQDLACQFAPAEGANSASARLAELTEIMATLAPGIHIQANGPYVLTNVSRVFNWLGEQIQARPQMALCRCGASTIKPWCDGSHAS